MDEKEDEKDWMDEKKGRKNGWMRRRGVRMDG